MKITDIKPAKHGHGSLTLSVDFGHEEFELIMQMSRQYREELSKIPNTFEIKSMKNRLNNFIKCWDKYHLTLDNNDPLHTL